MKFRLIAIASVLPLSLVAGCSSDADKKVDKTAQADTVSTAGGSEPDAVLRATKRKYLGIYVEGKYKDNPAAQSKVLKKNVGRAPNIMKHFQAWNAPYPADWAKAAYKVGALPQLEWEPHGVPLKTIAAGDSDAFLHAYAKQVKASKVPVMISFGHEMNGWWYDWATKKTTAKQFVAAWRHIHDIFKAEGATNAKWLWAPNVIYPMPKVKLKPLYPGNSYVDWVGVIGYYKGQKNATFKGFFEPTIKKIRTFSKKPILLAETGSKRGPKRNKEIADLLTNVAKRKDIIGLIWFNMNKPGDGDYRIEATKSSLKTFRTYVTKYPYGRK
ncbi:glycoside hydrolase family 26 protein [Actinocorallia longicatena]|uniref:GH26 domain-containing protein n=1 Tax=Actinocorallia longicatena TaxID=111803 RepID=A0ABP6QK94_9ACTN